MDITDFLSCFLIYNYTYLLELKNKLSLLELKNKLRHIDFSIMLIKRLIETSAKT